MHYFALACDYDGTIASAGAVSDETLHALKELKLSGRKIILVTGRRLENLKQVFPAASVFDRIVAENGAVLYQPETDETKVLAAAPPASFVQALAKQGVSPLDTGHVIVATREPHDATALQVIRELGLEMQVIYNKGEVMILPSGVNKATGTLAALLELGISLHNTAAVGDAENDYALLNACGVSVAVNNSIATLKEQADIITASANGRGVRELISRLLEDDLRTVSDRHGRVPYPR